MTHPLRAVDVAIVGAGTTGAAAALLCARRGLEVVCLERSTLDQAGSYWVNGVPASAFETAGIAPPEPPERLAIGVDFHLVAGWGPGRVVIRDHDLMEVDMRLLVERLQREARAAGAEFIDQTRVTGVRDGSLSTSRGEIEARWIVDASGLAGARLLDHAHPAPEDLCAAAQGVHRVTDHQAAREFVEEHGAAVGDTLCFAGIEGGYSILNIRLSDDHASESHVSLLTGSIPADGHRSGRQILADFASAKAWIGEPVFGGSRAIPIRRPYARLFDQNVCVIGDAACQVFAAHGSGIGPGMIAAKVLADALVEGRGLQGYATDWQRSYGGLFGAYALFRRFSQSLSAAELDAVMRSGLMDADMAAQGLLQRMPTVGPIDIFKKLLAATKEPRLAARLAPTIARMGAAQLVYAAYPRSADHLPRWERLCDALLGRELSRQSGSTDG